MSYRYKKFLDNIKKRRAERKEEHGPDADVEVLDVSTPDVEPDKPAINTRKLSRRAKLAVALGAAAAAMLSSVIAQMGGCNGVGQ